MKNIRHIGGALLILIFGLALTFAHSGMMEGPRTASLAGADGHHAAGMVTVTKDQKGNAVLSITEAKIDKVPDGRVHLAKDGDYTKGVELGKLKQFSGRLEFPIPAGIHPKDYNSVVIWCHKFNVKIGQGLFEQGTREKKG